MAFDVRATPSERTKTAEEAAAEEREKLEKLEVGYHPIPFDTETFSGGET